MLECVEVCWSVVECDAWRHNDMQGEPGQESH